MLVPYGQYVNTYITHVAAGGGGAAAGEDPGSACKDFTTEYAKSNRSTCRGCDDKIAKVL